MKRPRVLILQVGNYSKRIKFPKISREINQKYAELHGYDYKWETFESNLSFLDATSYKFIYISKYLYQYDIVVFIDADAAFVRPNIYIEDLIDDEHYIYLAQDIGIVSNNIHLSLIGNYFYEMISENRSIFLNFYNILENGKVNNLQTMRHALGIISTNPHALNSGFIILKPHADIKTLCDKLPVFIEFFNDYLHDQRMFIIYVTNKKI